MTEIKEDYKETEIGIIPEEWQVVRIEDIGEVKSSKRVYQSDYVDSGVPFYRSKEIIELSKNINPTVELFIEKSKYKEFKNKFGAPQKGDLMITSVGTIGKVWISDGREFYYKDGNITQFIGSTDISVNFIYQLFNSEVLKKQYLNQSYGSAQVALTIEKLNRLLIPLPSLYEQQGITEILSIVDKHIEKLDKNIEDYQLLKMGMMKKLLTEGIGHTEYKDTEIGRIPKEWEVKRVVDFTKTHKQGYYTKDEYADEGIPLVRVTDLQYSRISFEGMPKVKVSDEEYESFKIQKDDFLFARSGSIGRYGIVTSNTQAIFGSYLIRFAFHQDIINNRYFGIVFESQIVRKQLKGITQGTSNININAENIKNLVVPIPQLSEQEYIATVFSTIDFRIEKLESLKKDFILLKKALMEKLLTGKIRVKV